MSHALRQTAAIRREPRVTQKAMQKNPELVVVAEEASCMTTRRQSPQLWSYLLNAGEVREPDHVLEERMRCCQF